MSEGGVIRGQNKICGQISVTVSSTRRLKLTMFMEKATELRWTRNLQCNDFW
jgi:hypothetical protein